MHPDKALNVKPGIHNEVMQVGGGGFLILWQTLCLRAQLKQ